MDNLPSKLTFHLKRSYDNFYEISPFRRENRDCAFSSKSIIKLGNSLEKCPVPRVTIFSRARLTAEFPESDVSENKDVIPRND